MLTDIYKYNYDIANYQQIFFTDYYLCVCVCVCNLFYCLLTCFCTCMVV